MSSVQPGPLASSGRRWLRVGITLAFLAAVATQIDVGEMARLFHGLHWGFLGAAVGLALLERALSTLRWWLLLRARKVRIGIGPLIALSLTAGFAGSFLPTSFSVDVVRALMLSRRTGRLADSVASTVVDRGVAVVATLLVAIPLAAVLLPLRVWLIGVSALGSLGLLCVSLFVVFRARGSLGVPRLPARFGDNVRGRLRRLYVALLDYRNDYGVLLTSLALALGVLLLRIVITLCAALALQVEVSFAALAMVIPVVWVLVMLPISVGGFGLQEGAYALLLATVGVDPTSAVSISLLEHVIARAVLLPGVVLWMLEKRGPAAREPDHAVSGQGRGEPTGPVIGGRGHGRDAAPSVEPHAGRRQ